MSEKTSMEVVLEAFWKSIARWTEKEEPRICIVAQGAKRVLLGDDTYVYDERHFLITSVDLPTVV